MMEAARTVVPVPKTPPESDPRKEIQSNSATIEKLPPDPEEIEDMPPEDDGSARTISRETPGLAGN